MATEVQTPKAEAGNGKTGPKSSKELMTTVQDQRANSNVRIRSLGDLFRANQETLFESMPKHLNAERMIAVFLGCVRKTPKLLNCTVESVINAMRQAATYGLEPGDALGHAYLVPYKDECTFLAGYKGLIDMSRRSGNISTVYSEVVHEGDDFEYRLGSDPKMHHQPALDADRFKRPVTHVYAVFRLRDGGVQWKVMSCAEIDEHKKKHSQAWRYAENVTKKKDSTWHTSWEKMARKTVLREMINSGEVPVSAELQQLANTEQRIESEVIDVQVSSPKQVHGLLGLTDLLETGGGNETQDQPAIAAPVTTPPAKTAPSQASTSRPDTRAHVPSPQLHQPVADEDEEEGGGEAMAINDREAIMQQLQVDLDAAGTIKACKVVGEAYIRQYSRDADDTDAIVGLVAKRQAALRDRKEEAGTTTP